MVAQQPDAGFRYWAFISYSHQDKSWGRWLHRALETYRVPQRLVGMPIAAGTIPPRLTPVFRDRDELPTATDLDRTVAEALRQSWSLIVICSPASAQSRWVNEEVRAFQQLGRAERIHCLIVDGTAEDIAMPCFPPALREHPDDGSAAAEPVAADARRSGDGKSNARLKLVAGILGISFDRLVHREQQRSYRRVFAIACAAVLAFGVLAVFTFITITSRRDAEAQRSHAEGLVEFMLGDLRHKLEPEGRLSTLDAVGKEALAYYAAQDPASLDAEALARRARALHMIGDVYDQRGRLDDALGVFKQAAESTAELLARDKSNPQRIFDHAQSVYWVGYIAWQRGQKDTAEAAFQNYKALADRLVTIDPRKADWQAEVEYANSNLGTLLLEQGRASEASAAFERALQISLAISKAAPDDVQRQVEQAQSRAWLADAQLAQGRLREAMQQRQTEIAIYENILAVTPKDHDVTRLLVIGERAVGRLSLMLGDIQVAIAQLRDASKLAETLIQVDIENSAWREMDAGVQGDLGEALYYAGERDAAASTVARARELATRLVERDPSVVQWQLHMGRSLLLESRLQAANGDALGALRVAQGVIQRIEALPKANPPDRATLLLHAHSLMVASDQEVALGQAAAAAETRKQVVSLLSIEQIKTDPRLQALRASAERGLGRMEDAAPIVEALEHMGYREPDYVRRTAISEVAQNVTE